MTPDYSSPVGDSLSASFVTGCQGVSVSKKSKRRAKAAATPHGRKSSGIGVGTLVAGLLGVVSFVLLFGWNGLLPLLTVPLVVGLFLGLIATSLNESLLTGGSVGLLGSVLACFFYQQDAFVAYLQHTAPAATADVTGSLWQDFVIPLIQANPVNDPRVGPLAVVIFGTVLTLAFSAGAWWAADRFAPTVDRRWLGLAVIVPLGVCLSFTLFVNGNKFVTSISTEPVEKSYAYDGVVDLKAYYLIRGGMNYYDAIITAAQGDARINEIKDGKWNGGWGINSPSRVRQPAVFYLWAITGYFGASGVLWASVLLAIGLWVVWYGALYPTLGQRALFIAPALFPLFAVHMAWFNLFQPDWWAALMVMYSAAFMIRRRYIASAVFALFAVLFREILVIYLLAVLGVAFGLWLRKKLAGRDVAAFGVALVAFIAAYAAHYITEAPYLGAVAVKEGTLDSILSVASKPLWLKFMGPTSYLMFPYGDAVVPAFILVILGAVGVFLVLRDTGLARLALPAYLVCFLVFLATIGATSSYWGQDFSPLAVTGCAILLAGSDRLGRRAKPIGAVTARAADVARSR